MSQRRLLIALLVADLLWSLGAMCVAFALRYGVHWDSLSKESALHLVPFVGATWLIWSLFSFLLPLDGFRGGWRLSAVVSQLLLAVSGLMMILLSGGYLARAYVSRLALGEFCLVLFAGIVLIRWASFLVLQARSRNGWADRVVIVGGGHLARELARKIQRHPEMHRRVVGFLTMDDRPSGSRTSAASSEPSLRASALGTVDILSAQQTDEVILVLEENAPPELLKLAAACRQRGIKVSLVPQFYELYLSRSLLTDFSGIPVLELARPGLTVPALAGKRVLDLALGTFLALASVPLLAPLAIALRCMKGRAFRWETRCGFHGKPFAMLRLNVDRTASTTSRFEAFVREFSFTELPQLWNVLRGDMSLVGPRPESRDRVCRYSEWQQQRLTVKPGMTGLAQVQGLREQHSSEEKTRFDLQYLLNCSLWTDLSLLVQTVWTLVTRSLGRGDSIPHLQLLGTAEAIGSDSQQDVLEHAHRP
jgi:lipopolysaccharide/colanic/teichoic acid biosynthesis glycosyltransferase